MSFAMKQAVSDLSVPVPWGQTRGKVWGPEHGRPVLCLNGWADNCGTFNTLIPLLPKECRYAAVDLAGHGLSSHLPPGVFYTIRKWRKYAESLRVWLQWTKFSIIGHSMGGNIASLFSALYPEMVDTLVLLDSYGFIATDPKELSKGMRKGMDVMFQFEEKTEERKRVYTYEKAVERLSAANPSMTEQSVHIMLERGLVQVEGGFSFSRDLRINFKNIWRFSLEQSLELQSRIQASVLHVQTEKGLYSTISEPAQKKFHSILRCSQDQNHTVVTVPGDHHVHLNEPEVVAPIVSDFLRNRVLSQSNNGRHKL